VERVIGLNNRPYVTEEELAVFFDDYLRLQRELADISNEDEAAMQSSAESGAGVEAGRYDRPPTPPTWSTSLCVRIEGKEVLRTYEDVVSGVNAQVWREAIQGELIAHRENGTWCVVDRPRTGTTLSA